MFLCQIVLYDENPSEIQCYFDISILEELDETFNLLEKQYENKNGIITIAVILSSKVDMSINLCCKETVLHYYNAEKKPYHWLSVRDKDSKSDKVIRFWVATAHEWTEFPERHLIPQEQARHAVRYFVQTGGKLTDEMSWETPFSRINDDRNDPNYDNPFDADIPF